MSYSSGLVLAPVKDDTVNGDIQKALGLSTGDLGTLCLSGNINIFSKKKPIGISGVNPSASQWEAAHYGLKGPATSTRNSLATMSTAWTYDGATGGNYRALDFDGYYNGAIPPFRQANGTQLLVDLVGGNADAALFHLFMAEGGIANKPLSTSQGTASSGTAVPSNRLAYCICVEDAPYYGGGSYRSLVGGKCGLVIFDGTTYKGEIWASSAIAVQSSRDNNMFSVPTGSLDLPMGTYTAVACVKNGLYYMLAYDDPNYPTRFTLTVGGVDYYGQRVMGASPSDTGTPGMLLTTMASDVYVTVRLTNNSGKQITIIAGTNTKFTLVSTLTGTVVDQQGSHSISRTITTATMRRPSTNQTVAAGGTVDLVFELPRIWNIDETTQPTRMESGSITLRPKLMYQGTDEYPMTGSGVIGITYGS